MSLEDYFKRNRESYSTPNTSVLSALRKEKQPESPRRSNKEVNKKRSRRLDTTNCEDRSVNDVVLECELKSDNESPLPSSCRRRMAGKRKIVHCSSGSEDGEDVTQTDTKKIPDKHRSKRAKLDSHIEEQHKKGSKNKQEAIEDSDSEETATDSENEFIEKKVPKKKNKLLPGQTTLSFSKTSSKSKAASASVSSKDKPISASAFFGDDKSASKTEKSKATKISPSQKENVPRVTAEKVKNSSTLKRKSPTKIAVQEKGHKGVEPDLKEKSTTKIDLSKNKKDTVVENKLPRISNETVSSKKANEVSTKQPSTSVVVKKQKEVVYEVPWVDKHRPKTVAQLIGQHGDKSPLNKLLFWLKEWAKHNLGEGAKIKKKKPPPFATHTDGSPFKAALLSGSPGIGKTSSSHLACESLGFKVVEMNASDVRNKKHLEAQIAQLTGSHQIEEYFGKKNSEIHSNDQKVHHVLIMDEVDGMSGNEDRAGISELIQMIKDTKIPIICICNDRAHPKIRSLANHCYDIRFPKPRVEQIRSRIMSIACQEKIKVSKDELDQIIELSNHDVRQIIYNLQMRGASSDGQIQKKDCAINTFDAARRLLDSRATLLEKQEMFFVDYGIMPLFVQENYPNMKNDKHRGVDAIRGLRKAADLISLGDITDKCLRTTGAWKLLNEQCMFSSALPSIAVDGHLRAMIQFPSWLGKNSSAGKRQRMMRQLASHAHLKISADTKSLVTDYVPILRDRLTRPLLTDEKNGVQAVINTMTEYDLVKDDADAIAELAVWPGKIDPGVKIQSKVKAALTRALNKTTRMLPYAIDELSKGKKKAAVTDAEAEEEGNDADEEAKLIDEEGNVVELA